MDTHDPVSIHCNLKIIMEMSNINGYEDTMHKLGYLVRKHNQENEAMSGMSRNRVGIFARTRIFWGFNGLCNLKWATNTLGFLLFGMAFGGSLIFGDPKSG